MRRKAYIYICTRILERLDFSKNEISRNRCEMNGKKLVANSLPSTLIDDAFLTEPGKNQLRQYTDILHPYTSLPPFLPHRLSIEISGRAGCSSGGPFSPKLCVTDFRPPFSFSSPTTRLGGAFPRILSCVSFSSRGRGRFLSFSSIPVYRSPRLAIESTPLVGVRAPTGLDHFPRLLEQR